MYKPFSLIVVQGRNSDFPKNDSSISGRSAADLYQIPFDVEANELSVGQTAGPRPHFGLVLVPVVTGLDDFRSDRCDYLREGCDRVGFGGMRLIEAQFFLGGCEGTVSPSPLELVLLNVPILQFRILALCGRDKNHLVVKQVHCRREVKSESDRG
jgi:hypothetical protein